ncbi:hypothetical protein AB24_1778 [Escherichia coli 6-537-08_S1_C1]|nr:hypothetical protein AB24_1778 [Escherichia coli 6-537-08_S1_C1]
MFQSGLTSLCFVDDLCQILSLFLMNSVDCVTKLSLAGIQEGYATDRCM